MTYSYDGNGNQTGSSAGASLAYNSLDQSTNITPVGAPPPPFGSSSGMAMAHTGAGQSSRTGGGSTRWQEETGIGSMSTSTGTTYFTNSPDGDLISERTPTGTYYYLYDGLGSVVELTDSSGNAVNSYSYDPYGNTTCVTQTVFRNVRAHKRSVDELIRGILRHPVSVSAHRKYFDIFNEVGQGVRIRPDGKFVTFPEC